MLLAPSEGLARLVAHDHAVLCTVHHERGVDAVPVVYVVVDGHVGIPVDEVKPKASPRLQRMRNLEADPRATLLAEHWDADDWSQLWWVRVQLHWQPAPPSALVDALSAGLARRYRQYADEPFTQIIALQLVAVTGWSGER